MKKALALTLLLLVIISTAAFADDSEKSMLLRVNLKIHGAYELLGQNDFDVTYMRPGQFADIIATEVEFVKLADLGLKPEIIHDDLVAFYRSRFPMGTTMGGFRTLAEATSYMDSIHSLFPSITTARDSIGYSYQGRALWMMKISDNPDTDEDEPEFFVNSLIHAREPMGMEATLRFMRYLCDNYDSDPEATFLVDNREIYFVPVVNPDGYEYNRQTNPGGGGMWRKNRHSQGIDLNRNWGYMWGYDDNGSSPYPSDETYRGSGPFSEPETESMRQFIDSRDFSVVMNFHTYGNYFLYPWGYFDGYTEDQPLFTVIADSATAFNGYAPGTAWELLYNTNGDANDWQYGETTEKPRIFGFTIEIGSWFDGFWPDPSRIPDLWSEVLHSLLYLARISDNPYAVGAPSAPVLAGIGNVPPTFTISWSQHDDANPAVAFELKELSGYQRITDDIDSGSDNWTLNGFSRVSNRHHSGGYSLFSGSDDNYNGSAILANPILIASNDTLKFWTWYDIELDYDYAYAQLSTDGGVTFVNLPGNITTNYNPNGTNLGNGITGSSSGWIQAKFPLNSYVGQSVILGLRYRTDGGVLMEGFYADDFYPVETFSQEITISSDIVDTFYTVVDHVEGEFYYQVRARDAQDQWSGFSNRQIANIEGSGGCIFVPGDANGNNEFNGLDVSFSVSYLKGFGSAPPIACDCPPTGMIFPAADANGNCTFNGVDVTYSVSYLKGTGPAPIGCPDCL
jgi:hypothetical protein